MSFIIFSTLECHLWIVEIKLKHLSCERKCTYDFFILLDSFKSLPREPLPEWRFMRARHFQWSVCL